MNSINDLNRSVDPLRSIDCEPIKEGTHASGKEPLLREIGVSLVNTTKLPDGLQNKASEVRSTNYRLRKVAQEILGHNHRVYSCNKVPSYGVQKLGHARGISKNDENRAFFHGMASCGDVHCCPVCSVKISESRRLEVVHALRSHSESGYISLFATFTIRHSRNDSLSDNLTAFRNARSELISSRQFKEIKRKLCMTGYIRRLEVTWGESNGWHPHDHEVWFLDRKVAHQSGIEFIQSEVHKLWAYYCKKHGLGEPVEGRGFDLRYKNKNGSHAVGAYLTKWGHELTYGHTKTVNGENRYTPFSMLHSLSEKYNPKISALYQEYAKAFKGRAQLLWSRGLKTRFGIEEFKDGELAERPEKVFVCDLTTEQAFGISFLNRYSSVLDYAERYSPEATLKYIDSLKSESNSILVKNFKRRRSNYISNMELSNMLDAGIYDEYIN